jgi:hypothetical protein
MNDTQQIVQQIAKLSNELGGAFPYDDCRIILRQVQQERLVNRKKYADLIPDLDSYFDLVEMHATGINYVEQWESSRLAQSEVLLKPSFFQRHTKYRPLEWRVNQVNTPELYRRLAVSDQLRRLLVTLMSELMQKQRQKNQARQEDFLLSAA